MMMTKSHNAVFGHDTIDMIFSQYMFFAVLIKAFNTVNRDTL